MTTCDYHDQLLESLDTETMSQDMQLHLQQCPECRAEQQRYSRLMATLIHQRIGVTMNQMDENNDLPQKKLPPNVMQLVRQRKKHWLREQLKKSLGSQGVIDKDEQQKRLEQLMKEPAPDLPLAAFPDDLHDDEEN